MNETLKTILQELLQKMGYDPQIYERQEEGRTVFNVKTRDAQLLIGKQGANLESLQYIVRILFRKKTGDDRFPFAVDIDDYKDKRVLYLKELARKAAHHVRETRKPVSLEPMPSYERRVVHSYLSLYNDIGSESVGVEPNRKLIIKPKVKAKDPDGFDFVENM
ncbi:MAG: KH domain-containing protein [Candidatus Doudnabacteria bacterium]|nr:KH domain-containing protein [Candidatus Doudnabacteria bacterium]